MNGIAYTNKRSDLLLEAWPSAPATDNMSVKWRPITWVVHSGLLVTVIILIIPCPFFVLLWQSQAVSCTFWHVGDCDHADNLMSILYPALAIIGSELCLWACWSHDHSDHPMSILYPALEIIVGELCILPCWWLWSCWSSHVHSLACSGNHRQWVVCSDMLVTMIMLIILYPFFVLLWQS